LQILHGQYSQQLLNNYQTKQLKDARGFDNNTLKVNPDDIHAG